MSRKSKSNSKSKKSTNKSMDRMKYEIANELGIKLGADTTSRLNGTVGGYMTKKLVELGKQYYTSTNK